MGQLFASAKSADAPDLEGGLYDAKFLGLSEKFIEGGQYGDGTRYVWNFNLLDDDGNVISEEREDNPNFGDPLEVDALTSMSLNTQSKTTPKAVRFLKALCTDDEFAAFEDGKGVDTDALEDRKVQVEVTIRDSGWPTIVNVLPARKARRSSRSADA